MPKNKVGLNSDLIWAQMRYCPYWPARIVEAPPFLTPIPTHKICVLFFGSREYGLVDQEKVKSYIENREKFVSKGKNRGAPFNNAVQRLEEYMSDRMKHRSNATVMMSNKRAQIKTERSIEEALGIKTEPNSTTKNHRSNDQQSNQDNKTFINKIAALQKENQRYVLDLKKKDAAFATLKQEKQKLEHQLTEKVLSLSTEVKTLQSQLSTIKIQHAKQRNGDKNIISELNEKVRMLGARNKQLQTGSYYENKTHANQNKSNESDDNVFEVDKLIGHKKQNDGMHFLVRWKNFPPENDTWERETNLMCPEVLDAYKQKWKI